MPAFSPEFEPVTAFECVMRFWELLLLIRLRRAASGNSLRAAWNWMLAAWFICCLSTLLGIDGLDSHIPNSFAWISARHLAGYVAGVFMLAPMVSVLGARMPGGRAWSVFVVAPMILVLLWPAISEAFQSKGQSPIELGGPAVLGFLLVLLMAFGNYFGTANTTAAVLYTAAIMARIGPVAGWHNAGLLPWIASGFPPVAGYLWLRRLTELRSRKPLDALSAGNRCWFVFRDFFGIVWAKRVMDRMNVFAAREGWGIHLSLDGFDIVEPDLAVGSEQMDRPIAILEWLLSRFSGENWRRELLGDFYVSKSDECREV
ncbi:MAG: hypothetical protein KDA91_16480 [Planctomycetaceae bacterium]|nr:hypothetical protein [Planctomycetaceae bacterium]